MSRPSWTDGQDDPEVAEVLAAERETLSPSCRADPQRLSSFLAEDFHEYGASGGELRREGTAERVADSTPRDIAVRELRGLRVADGVVLVKYTADNGQRRTHRTSLWRRREQGGWEMFHHQGTITEG